MKNFYFEPVSFKKFLVVFWAVWWAAAFVTDLFGALKQCGILQYSWIYTGNYPDLVKTLSMYHTPLWLVNILFVAIIFGSFVCTWFFVRASIALLSRNNDWFKQATLAYMISLLYWLAFFMADQLTMRFDLIENHATQAAIEFFCFLLMFLVPDRL